tara:strand:- start:745 stop:1122 length:378 start_codon:yes stop_codon:yes gene_type:complete
MSNIPAELKYTKEHEWVKVEGDTVTVGITEYAQESLGDITFVELPQIGEKFDKEDTFGVVESVKAASDLYSPISGEVVETNESLEDAPETINSDPYTNGWIMKLKVSNSDELSELLSADDYKALV